MQPERIILVACCNKPTRDRISRLVFFLFSQDVIRKLSNSGHSESLASRLVVSSIVPRKVRIVDGPSTFSRARGIPGLVHTYLLYDTQILLRNVES